MKKQFDEKSQCMQEIPETSLENVQLLEKFLLQSLKSGIIIIDEKFLRKHFGICKKRIKNLNELKKNE
jgi:hypothetical protein